MTQSPENDTDECKRLANDTYVPSAQQPVGVYFCGKRIDTPLSPAMWKIIPMADSYQRPSRKAG